MVFPLSLASGGGAIPITGGAATSGPVDTAVGGFGPVNVGGLFGSPASSSNPLIGPALIAGAVILAVVLLRRR